jgi:hypothetical protein
MQQETGLQCGLQLGGYDHHNLMEIDPKRHNLMERDPKRQKGNRKFYDTSNALLGNSKWHLKIDPWT